ncbi:actin interacting protein 3-domain-containing protein [Kalaharituber pfeilii]|nr:actin interacting protein 3-domain-containing protein [Kalaharituber pfeilii]
MKVMQSPAPPPPPSSTRGSGSIQRQTSSNAHHSGSMSSSHNSSTASSSSRPSRNRDRNQVNLSTIEKSVTHLLIATKQLLETLTSWSRGNATEAEVSDVYVRLGSEFNIACRAFTAIGVETADLGNVPDALRAILESTLSQDASPASLDVYLPRIREIIINLLHGLKKKQSRLRQRQTGGTGESSGSRSSGGSGRVQSTDSLEDQITPPRTSPMPVTSPNRGASPTTHPPYPTSRTREPNPSSQAHQSTISSSSTTSPGSPTPEMQAFQAGIPPQYFVPPPPPEEDNPLIALQRGKQPERRASRRYSAFHSKHSGVPVPMPPIQASPTPRHREPQDTSEALRNSHPRRMKTTTRADASPMRKNRISEERETDAGVKSPELTVGKTAENASESDPVPPSKDAGLRRQPSLKVDTVISPSELSSERPKSGDESRPKTPISQDVSTSSDTVRPGTGTSAASHSKEMVIFLQIGRQIKKVVLSEGVEDLSLTSIRLLFIAKFNYNPPAGEDFPEIYLQDPTSGVRYELEDLNDVKDRSVLCLNIEVLDEVKRHIDDGIGGLRKLVEGVKGMVDGQAVALQRVAERQEDAAKKIAELSVAQTAPPTPPTVPTSSTNTVRKAPTTDNASQLGEIRDLRKDLAVLRQIYSSFVSDVNNSMTTIKTKAANIKATFENASTLATLNSAPGSGRAYVEEGKKTLGTDADNLVTRVDDLQDLIEELRKDVVMRGVRPLHRQLENVSKDLVQAKNEVRKMAEYIKREKPKWKKVWEKELEVVCEDQQFFNMQEELITDLQDDLDKASQTFALVEQCTQQQLKTARNTSKGFQPTIDETLDVVAIKDNLLSEVRALQPNHENRLEAIERAERLRQKELEGRVPEFKKELGSFVEQGKLRKAGGVEEAERLRKARDEQILKETWAQENASVKVVNGNEDENSTEVENNTSGEPAPDMPSTTKAVDNSNETPAVITEAEPTT